MNIVPEVASLNTEMCDWRHHIHAHPETAFEETATSAFVAGKLEAIGLDVHTGLAKTGVVGVLRCGSSGDAIGLRADMDALHIAERSGVAYASRHEGRMHACGHDGHTAMLLGAAKALARRRRFDGTVYFIFQPAEENEGGGRVMVEEGLFDKFPMRAVYGMHNWPNKPLGSFAMRPGPLMGAYDVFEIVATGKGAHAAMAYMGKDPMLFVAQAINALQTIVARNLHPLAAGVVSVTQVHGGDTWNVIPERVVMRGTTRSFDPAVRDSLEPTIRRIAEGVCAALGATVAMHYERRYPPTVNSADETELAAATAAGLVGIENVRRDMLPCMGAEDFGWFLEKRPGAYIWIGNGAVGRPVHSPHYEFNDEILSLGASYWARLAEGVMAI